MEAAVSQTDLTPAERIKCAYLSVVCGIENQHLAVAYEVNMGRISEAIHAIELAAADPRFVRRAVEVARNPLPTEAPEDLA